MGDIWDRTEEAQAECARLEQALFAASWERMVLLAVYVGPTHLWHERFDDAYMGMISSRPKQDVGDKRDA